MTQHYQKNVTSIYRWCETCGRRTAHRVDESRVGNCMESHAEGLSKKQEDRLRKEIKRFERDKRDGKQVGLFSEEK
jgi:hypothetical protein